MPEIIFHPFPVRSDDCAGCGSTGHDTFDCPYANDGADEDTYCLSCDRYTDHDQPNCPDADEDTYYDNDDADRGTPGPRGCGCSLCREARGRTRDRDLGDRHANIHYFDYQPVPEFHGVGPLFLGMELEVEFESGRRQAGLVAEEGIGELGYLKQDGSLSNGFEIVTHPMSYPFFMRKFPWELLARLRDAGAETSDGTGIHVHVSRAGFADPVHQFKWLKWWHRSRAGVSRLAGRSSGRWAAFRPEERAAVKNICKGRRSSRSNRRRLDGSMPSVERYDDDYYEPDRYSAINVTNPDTYEVRVFRSSLEPDRVKSMIGLVDASVHFTRELTVPDIFTRQAWSWSGLSDWVDATPARRAKYRDLVQPMADAAILSHYHGRGIY